MPARHGLQHEGRFSVHLCVSTGLCFIYTAFSNMISHHILFANTFLKAFHCFVSNILLLEVFLVGNDILVMLLLSTKDDTGKSGDIT